MPDVSRLAELEHLVADDPTSVVFAQLAEDYRRAGRFDDAVRTSRAGLMRHPDHHSARLTLARALLSLDQRLAAQTEFELILHQDPEHLAATRSIDELRRMGLAVPEPVPADPALQELESWLRAIVTDRAARRDGKGNRAGAAGDSGSAAATS